MKKEHWIFIVLFSIAVIAFFLGPVPTSPNFSNKLPEIPNSLTGIENFIYEKQDTLPLREDNQARIIWHNNTAKITEYGIIYLHGFAGSYRDGYPVNLNIADTLGANLYLSRIAGHGLKPPASLNNFSALNAWASAKESLVIGKRIGEKVIVLSTSTGGTLALKLAAEFPDDIHAIINLSPNFQDDVPGTFVLNSPWGYEIAKLISFGKNKEIEHESDLAKQYWDTIYPSRALVDLQVLVSNIIKNKTIKEVEIPVLTLYFHENTINEDEHVEVSVYPEIHEKFTTPDSLIVLKSLDTPGTHFIGSDIKSKDTEVVEREIVKFLKEQLGIRIE